MNICQDKTTSLSAAVKQFVFSGCHLSIGGFTVSRNPMAAVYEIIRQKISNIHLYAHSNGQGVDELIGADCVSRLEIAYAGSGRFAPTCIRFKKAAQSGAIAIEDYSNYQMTLNPLWSVTAITKPAFGKNGSSLSIVGNPVELRF